MGKKKAHKGLSPDKVARLLQIGPDAAEAGAISPDTVKAELLRDRLANHLPAQGLTDRQLLACLKDLREILVWSAEDSIEKVLLAPDTPVEALRRIKEYGVSLSRSAQSDPERETANVVYYGAIASALVFHCRRITEFTSEDLELAFTTLSGLPWLPRGLSGHFKKAVGSCRGWARGKTPQA
ncbi:MAG: hypothetical protein KBE04_03280 [Phycisphaerae bacterium]|nr:hypothetical protein [Phycisphaerae bacterium]